MPSFARVSVNIPQLTGLFDYQIPAEFTGLVQPGVLVNVPFGRQTAQGVVAVDDGLPGRAQQVGIQGAVKTQQQLLVVGGRIGKELRVVQHALLHGGQRADILDFFAGELG